MRRILVCMMLSGLALPALAEAPLVAKPLVYGHRGASALRPEHTLASYAKAIADGADFVEPDLVSTKDGVLVARHENEIGGTTDVASHPEFAGRKTRKSIDGEQVEGWFTEDFTLAELKALRARERLPQLRGTRWDGQFQLITLDEIIDFVAAESAARDRVIGIVPEIKHPSYFQSIGLGMEDKVLTSLQAHAYTRSAPVVIQSFERDNLRYLRGRIGRDSNIRLLQLIARPEDVPGDVLAAHGSTRYADMLTPDGLRAIAQYADAIGPDLRAIIPLDADKRLGKPTALVREAHAVGLQVQPYTFRPENYFLPAEYRVGDDPASRNDDGTVAEMRVYLKAGIDAFFTDDPALGRRAVDGR
jgi:glycerophosphoryl diester phosphodiesterase